MKKAEVSIKKLAFNSPKIEAPENSNLCKAHGCRLLASIDAGGGFVCRYHQAAEDFQWPAVTEAINQSIFIFDLMKDIKQARNDKQWFALATEFWEEERMRPIVGEKAGQYLYRLHYEVMFRAGLLKKNPSRIIRADVKKKPENFEDEPTYVNDYERTEALKKIAAEKVRAYMEAHQ